MKYAGGCHCGAVRFEAEIKDRNILDCNCSYCLKAGHLLSFVGAQDFKLVQGEGHLTDYLFNKNVIHHLFCKECGIHPFGSGKNPDGSDTFAINMRCVDDIELSQFTVQQFDGKNM